jgi:hypothetical protein
MESKYNFSYKWTQPYATYQQRPYLRSQHEAYEQLVERMLEDGDFKEANEAIAKIMSL